MIIRPMTARDAEAVARLVTELGYPATPEDVARRFDRIDWQENQVVLVAEQSGQVIAWVHAAIHPYLEHDASAEILGLVVADGHRSRGVGEALVRAAESWAEARGCRALRVRSRITRERAHAFYERHGFRRIKTQHCFEKALGEQ